MLHSMYSVTRKAHLSWRCCNWRCEIFPNRVVIGFKSAYQTYRVSVISDESGALVVYRTAVWHVLVTSSVDNALLPKRAFKKGHSVCKIGQGVNRGAVVRSRDCTYVVTLLAFLCAFPFVNKDGGRCHEYHRHQQQGSDYSQPSVSC